MDSLQLDTQREDERKAAIATTTSLICKELDKKASRFLITLQGTWSRDIALNIGDGWIDEKEGTELFTFLRFLHVPMVSQDKIENKMQIIDEPLNALLSIYSESIDENVYVGYKEKGTFGLTNNPNVCAQTTQKAWAEKTPDEILEDVNMALTSTGTGNHILIPFEQYGSLVSRKVGKVSLLTFLTESNVFRKAGIDVNIFPSHWCMDAGVGGTDRMVTYSKHRDNFEFDITVPLVRTITQANENSYLYVSSYAAQHSSVNFKNLQAISYLDGI